MSTKNLNGTRTGLMATVYEVRRDPTLNDINKIRNKNEVKFPFISGSSYKGEWNQNKKEGFGVQTELDDNKYEGEWARNKKNGKGTLWVKKGKKLVKQYEGDWEDDLMSGYGIYYYENGNIYKGNWIDGKKNGSGKLEYSNGDIYEGEWYYDKRHGLGVLFVANGNIYDGNWFDDLKHGPGLYLYSSTRKVYEGEWSNDQAICGEFRSPNEDEALFFNEPMIWESSFQLPELELENPGAVIKESIDSLRI